MPTRDPSKFFCAFTNAAILQWLQPFAGGIVLSFVVAGTRADRSFRLVDLVKRASSGRDSTATLGAPPLADRRVLPVQSNILATRAELTSDRTPLFDNKSLFDIVPLLDPFLWLRSGFQACPLNRGEKSTAKER
jgi:hypothetical protein